MFIHNINCLFTTLGRMFIFVNVNSRRLRVGVILSSDSVLVREKMYSFDNLTKTLSSDFNWNFFIDHFIDIEYFTHVRQ